MPLNINTNSLSHRYVSALEDYPGGAPPAFPTVTVIVPLYNEVNHVAQLAEEILSQDYPQLNEIFFIDGMSTDGTREALQKYAESDGRVRLLSNPRRVQSAALNIGVGKSNGDIILRLDAHAQYAPDMVSKSVELLLATGSAGVGPVARPIILNTPLSQSIATALESKLGAGAAQFRNTSTNGWVDTIWNGCYWAHVVRKVGRWREDYARIEDNDFNFRVRALGYGLYCSTDIHALYYPRQSLKELWDQYAANGAGIVQALFSNWRIISLRHLAPLAFVSCLLMLALLGYFWPLAGFAALGATSFYIGIILLLSLKEYLHRPGYYAVLLPMVFFTFHFGYGCGSLLELVKTAVKRGALKSTYNENIEVENP